MRRPSSQLWRTVDEPAIDKGLRTRMAKGVEVASVFEDALEAVLDWTFPTTRST